MDRTAKAVMTAGTSLHGESRVMVTSGGGFRSFPNDGLGRRGSGRPMRVRCDDAVPGAVPRDRSSGGSARGAGEGDSGASRRHETRFVVLARWYRAREQPGAFLPRPWGMAGRSIVLQPAGSRRRSAATLPTQGPRREIREPWSPPRRREGPGCVTRKTAASAGVRPSADVSPTRGSPCSHRAELQQQRVRRDPPGTRQRRSEGE